MPDTTITTSSISKMIIFVSSITCLVFCIVLLTLFVCLPLPSFLSYLGYANSVALANTDNINNDLFTSYMVGELVKSGTLISLKDVWSFQSGFYQTIIAFLIAINGLIAAVSVIYIKSTSEEKAEETTKKYMNGDAFNHVLNSKIEAEAELRLRVVKDDFNSTAALLESSFGDVNAVVEQLELLKIENQTLRQQIKVISERIAKLDTSETEGKDNQLFKKEQ